MNLGADNYKMIARDALKGHWGSAVIAGMIAVWLGAFATSFGSLCEYAAGTSIAIYFLEGIPGYMMILLTIVILCSLFYFFIGSMIRLGYIDYNLALLDRRKAAIRRLFAHFPSIWRMILVKIMYFFIISLSTLMLIIPGIISIYSYAMVPYVLEEKPGYSISRIFRASRRIMQGHKWQLFKLRFSFLGWNILGLLTLGLGFLFIIPYRYAAEAAFYNEISGRADAYYKRDKKISEEDLFEDEDEEEEE